MPDASSDPRKDNAPRVAPVQGADLSSTLPRLSIKTGLAVFLPAGLLLFFLSRYNYLLYHLLVELASIVLLTAVFLIGWNTRQLVRSQFFLILAVGFLSAGLVDLLHTLTYKGMLILPIFDGNVATQMWLIARTLGTSAFLLAIASLGRVEVFPARYWLIGFLAAAGILLLAIWPFGVFPTCLVEGVGLTPFKIGYEYALIILLGLAAVLLQFKSRGLNRHLTLILTLAILVSALSEMLFTLYSDVYGFFNFLGHYFKLGSLILVYFALIEGTLRSPFATLFREMTASYEELNEALQQRVLAEKQKDLAHQEVATLYRMSRVMHSTLNLDELSHLLLSAVTSRQAGGFERATLFTVNPRTGMLQGMLGVSRETAALVFPEGDAEMPCLDEHCREAQRTAPYNQVVVKQRLPLDQHDNALARAYQDKRVVLVAAPDAEPEGGRQLAKALGLGPYACAPLPGRDQMMGILLVDNPGSAQEIKPDRRRFLELFANQAGSALDNASLVKKLEIAHRNLQDVQEQLIHGEKMAVLGEMAAQVAHELRNPLVSIGGFAQRLSRQDLQDPKANEYAGIIAREVRRLEEMLGNILAFSKKQLVCLELCSVGETLQEAIDLERDHCQKQGIQIVCQLNGGLPDILGDPRQLRQVFLNLIINARQVMPNGGVLTVRARSGALRGEEAVMAEVEDTGGGISPEILRNIFNPFFSTSAKGTGLGLSISHRIVAHHHGEIEVINAEKGARFIVVLPVVQSKAGNGGANHAVS